MGFVIGGSAVAHADPWHRVIDFDARDNASTNPNRPWEWTSLGNQDVTAVSERTGVTMSRNGDAIKFRGGVHSGFSFSMDEVDFSQGIRIDARANFGRSIERWERIVDLGNGSETDNIILGRVAETENLFFEVWSWGSRLGRIETTTEPLVAGAGWHTYTATLGPDLVPAIFVDGVEQESVVTFNSDPESGTFDWFPPTESRADCFVGDSNWVNDSSFRGAIQYVRIYNYGYHLADRPPV